MATEFKVRRGTTAEHAAFTGAEGEITLDTNKDTLVVHDNYQAGGYPMLREDLNNLANNSVNLNKIETGTQGEILYYDATGQLQTLAPSTSGRILTTNGAGANPSWSDNVCLGWGYKKFTGREARSGESYFTGFTLNYTKKVTNSRLVLTSFLFGESSDHDHRLSVWNSVDGYFSENGYEPTALKIDEGGYTSSDVNSTPGSGHHTAVTSKIAAGTNVEFRWYVKNQTVVLGGSYNTSGNSWEHAACWMVVQELYDGS